MSAVGRVRLIVRLEVAGPEPGLREAGTDRGHEPKVQSARAAAELVGDAEGLLLGDRDGERDGLALGLALGWAVGLDGEEVGEEDGE